ncbi:SWIM zinc finger family protein [Actinocatenispora comari]|uniref:SWIM-type domain-containing protein n=1 Tax=Actinocatenispora comari TaxID=2807577 RepID=A0A8J4AIP2_9ACTN|nr:hypothetical protein [Actinocatenispora comari]GIL31918.1 hypothetical protein NUM_71720 [Actinocatenispora comari]
MNSGQARQPGYWSGRLVACARLTDDDRYPADRVSPVEVTAGSAAARVRGSHARPYQVWVEIPVFTPVQWAHIERALSADATVVARLLGGTVPAEVEALVATVGVSLVPDRAELTMECSCPQWSVPCRHLTATLRALAESFDDDPFRLLLWRGRGRERLRARLQASAAARPSTVAAAGPETNRVAAPLPSSAHAFWLGEHPEQLAWPDDHPPQDPDPAIRHLAAAEIVVGRRNLTDLLQPLYEDLTSW